MTLPGYVNAIKRCNNMAPGHGLGVIELPLTLSAPLNSEHAAEFAGSVATARANGLSVVAAADNNHGGPVEVSASQPGAGARRSAANGQRCAGSASGAALQAPGCELDEVDPLTGDRVAATAGTGQASALVAAAVAALRSWRPELSPARGRAGVRRVRASRIGRR